MTGVTRPVKKIQQPVRPETRRRIWPYFFTAIIMIFAAYASYEIFLIKPSYFPEEQLPAESPVKPDPKDQKNGEKKSDPVTPEKVPEEKTQPVTAKPKTPEPAAIKTQKNDPVVLDKPVQANIQVEVLNGCGERGMASTYAGILRKMGFDVVKTGNYKSMAVANTQIIDRVGNLDFARQIGRSMGVRDRYVYTQKDRSLLVDATVIIGKDHGSLQTNKGE